MNQGSCLCGSIVFEVGNENSAMSHCHCSMCRKLHGALFATYFRTDNVRYRQGESFKQQYESSPGFMRCFCGRCGSPLPDEAPDGFYVPAGLMDDDPGVRPESHIFVASKADWHTITDDLPQHDEYSQETALPAIDTPASSVSPDRVTGGCLCGRVGFEFAGTPKMMMNCHCSRCRKVKGAAHASNAFVAGDQFDWTQGEEYITNYAHTGARVFGNAFCSHCGSSVPRARVDGSVYNVPVGSLNQAPGIEARGHIFVDSKAPWFDITEDKPQWSEMPD